MKKLLRLLILLIVIFPILTIAKVSYKDSIYEILNVNKEENIINLYLFYGDGCPHCKEEKEWLEEIKEKYKDNLNVYEFEVWNNNHNKDLIKEVRSKLEIARTGLPLTIINDEYYSGFSSATGSMIESKIKELLVEEEKDKEVIIPILGNINIKKVSIPLVAIILGFVDGFNPCAMWILLFLINLLFNLDNKKRAWLLGLTFLFVSGFVYFLSMLGINFVLEIATLNWMKLLIALFILITGILNVRKYINIRNKEAGCEVVKDNKRRKLITRMRNILSSKSFLLSILGIILLAASVNLIEMACSLGFPVIFTEILAINKIKGITKILFLILYILFYMIDDIVVFSISMLTLEATGITNKYNKLCTLISGIIMIIMGLLLIFKPEWLMFNI